jgi:hypothetical protein
MSIWGAYVENMYDLIAYIHRVVPQELFLKNNAQLFKNMLKTFVWVGVVPYRAATGERVNLIVGFMVNNKFEMSEFMINLGQSDSQRMYNVKIV